MAHLRNPDSARLVFQSDFQDSVGRIVNWHPLPDLGIRDMVAQIMVEGQNQGLKHSFRLSKDHFNQNPLINHQPYYFTVVAYAHNEYRPYNPATNLGQGQPYLQGWGNVQVYTGIPRPNAPEYGGISLNSVWGQAIPLSRLDGQGNGLGQFLRLADEAQAESRLIAQGRLDSLSYAPGQGPVKVRVVDPLRVPKGRFRLYFSDERYTWLSDSSAQGPVLRPLPPDSVSTLFDSSRQIFWTLLDLDRPWLSWRAYQPLSRQVEQYIPELGIAIEAFQPERAEAAANFLGAQLHYRQGPSDWYRGLLNEYWTEREMLATWPGGEDRALDPEERYQRLSQGGWYSVPLSNCRLAGRNPYLSLNLQEEAFCDVYRSGFVLGTHRNQRNVNVVLTPDKSRWSRCIVLESASPYLNDLLNQPPPSGLGQLDWKRGQPSRDKEGLVEAGSTGYSWFPGYAYDVETGERLNILFAENSYFDGRAYPALNNGHDMLFNPSADTILSNQYRGPYADFVNGVYGGQHVIYVARSPYDSCRSLVELYNRNPPPGFSRPYRIFANHQLIWASMAYLAPGSRMAGAVGNIPPGELKVELRVSKPHNIFHASRQNKGYPLYSFELDGFAPQKGDAVAAQSALDLINVVPNPYYAHSAYTGSQGEDLVKITNLPAHCELRIYSLDGRLQRQHKLQRDYANQALNGPANLGLAEHPQLEAQIRTSWDWDLRDHSGKPLASGVYLIHVLVPGVGERVLKSFIIQDEANSMRR